MCFVLQKNFSFLTYFSYPKGQQKYFESLIDNIIHYIYTNANANIFPFLSLLIYYTSKILWIIKILKPLNSIFLRWILTSHNEQIYREHRTFHSESLSTILLIRLNALRASRCRGGVLDNIAFLPLSIFFRARVTRPKINKKKNYKRFNVAVLI